MTGIDPIEVPEEYNVKPYYKLYSWTASHFKSAVELPEILQERPMFPDVMLRFMLFQEALWHYKTTD